MTQPRSSLAIALQDYKGPRPGIALTIAAVALLGALLVGVAHTVLLGRSSSAIREGGETMRTLHRYNAGLEVWRQMATTGVQFPDQRRLLDSLGSALHAQLFGLRDVLTDSLDQALVGEIVADLESWRATSGTEIVATDLGVRGREAMMVLAARQDSALFRAAAQSQQSQMFAAVLIALTIIAAGVLIIPMSWVYVRYKRGIPPGM